MVVLGGWAVSYERGTPVRGHVAMLISPPWEVAAGLFEKAQHGTHTLYKTCIQEYLAHKTPPTPPRTPFNPLAQVYGRVREGCVFF